MIVEVWGGGYYLFRVKGNALPFWFCKTSSFAFKLYNLDLNIFLLLVNSSILLLKHQ